MISGGLLDRCSTYRAHASCLLLFFGTFLNTFFNWQHFNSGCQALKCQIKQNTTSILLECSDVGSRLYDGSDVNFYTHIDPQGSDDKNYIISSSDEDIIIEGNIEQLIDSDYENLPNKRT